MPKFIPKVLLKESNSTVKHIIDANLKENATALFNSLALKGRCNLYALYIDDETNRQYGLVHADYMEKDGFNKESFLATVKEDANTMHTALLASKLELQYFFIMPYFITLEEKCFLYEIILTDEMDT